MADNCIIKLERRKELINEIMLVENFVLDNMLIEILIMFICFISVSKRIRIFLINH